MHRAVLLRRAFVVIGCALLVGCDFAGGEDAGPSVVVDPDVRAVRIETTGCESERTRFGSGVVIEEGMAATVAHLVVEARSVTASVEGGPSEQAEVAAVDLRRDLAILRVDTDELPEVETALADSGAEGRIVGGAASGTVPFEVRRRVNLTIEEILGTERHARLGYELAAITGDGDSGAGAYDEEDRLIGIVFATGRDGGTTWLTASAEIEDFLSTVGPADAYPPCQ